jgi:hypothetical protein
MSWPLRKIQTNSNDWLSEHTTSLYIEGMGMSWPLRKIQTNSNLISKWSNPSNPIPLLFTHYSIVGPNLAGPTPIWVNRNNIMEYTQTTKHNHVAPKGMQWAYILIAIASRKTVMNKQTLYDYSLRAHSK